MRWQRLVGQHRSHDNFINDRGPDAPRTQTEAVFAREWKHSSEPGGKLRGVPTLLMAAQRA